MTTSNNARWGSRAVSNIVAGGSGLSLLASIGENAVRNAMGLPRREAGGRRRSASAAGLRSGAGGGVYRRVPGRVRGAGRLRVPTVFVDGTTGGRYKMQSKKKKKKSGRGKKKFSAKREISKLKANMPKYSTKTFRDFKTMVLSSPNPNEHIIFDINCFDKNKYQTYAQNLTLVDSAGVANYSNENSKIKMSSYYKLMLKNNRTSNAIISYAFYVCKDDDGEGPVDKVREELVDRGYTGLPVVQGVIAASALQSEVPRRLELGALSPYHVPVFSGGALSRNWATSGVKHARLGPGDSTELVWSRKNWTYNQEAKDQEDAFTHIKGFSIRLLISIHGDLAHDNTNKGLIGRQLWQLDCEEQRQNVVRYFNPKGLNEVEYSDTLTNTNFGTPVHADNFASAVEQANR